jgi:hypothetical protein
MDKLQKLASWFWWNKERIVLLLMVGVLTYRVYEIASPAEPENMPTPRSPLAELPPPAEAPEGLLPPSVPGRPPAGVPEDYGPLVRRNPWSFHASPAGGRTTVAGEQEEEISLLRIQMVRGEPRAQLRAGSQQRWVGVGQDFGNDYRVDEIDAEEGTAVVYAQRLQRPIQLEIGRGS